METETNIYPLLNAIDSPADLRKLNVEQLPEVCDELRHDILDEASHNPGHVASNLGTVELTVALHYVFNTPYDRIVWDVGHQAYGHKILTGRREAFHTNRQPLHESIHSAARMAGAAAHAHHPLLRLYGQGDALHV